MKYLIGRYYNGCFGTGTTAPYKVYKARNKHDAERMFQYEFGRLGGVKCSVFRNKCLFLNKKEITIHFPSGQVLSNWWGSQKVTIPFK